MALANGALKDQTGFAAMPSGGNRLLSALRNRILHGEEKSDSLLVYDIFQRPGLGSLTAALCVWDFIDSGLRPEWHCREKKPASIVVAAEKVGLSDPVHYKSLFLDLADGS